jgi:[ribosomal protein S18]-alanine N-acetyltransferase
MCALPLKRPLPICVRAGDARDLDALMELEACVFSSDRMQRRSVRHFLTSRTASVMVAEIDGRVVGAAIILFGANRKIARLYSLAVEPPCSGRGVGPALIEASEDAARARACTHLRLEVHEKNRRAIDLYRKAGYREFARCEAYYDDKGNALRFEKRVAPRPQLPRVVARSA